MKLILVVLSLFTVQAQASSSDEWYALDSRSCSTGQEFQVSAAFTESSQKYMLSEDLTQLTIQTTQGEVTESRVYSLTMMGKNAYLASPQFEGGDETDHFFVSTGDVPSRVIISAADRGGEHCKGGLVLSSASRQSQAAASL